MTNIVAFAGKIGAGKSTLRNFLFGYTMKHYVPSIVDDGGLIDTYQINSLGHLLVPGETHDGVAEMGQLDPVSRDPDVRAFLKEHVWEYVKAYSFAGKLKVLAHELFGFPEESIYGTQEQKLAKTDRSWQDMAGVITPAEAMTICDGMRKTRFVVPTVDEDGKKQEPLYAYSSPYDPGKPSLWCCFPDAKIAVKDGNMSGRDFLQYFGTEVCRRFHNNVWANACIAEIAQDQPFLAVIDDLRFENELLVTKANAGVTYWLTRNSSATPTHSSEESLGPDSCDVVVDNANMTIEESCLFVLKDMKERGILQ